LNSQFGMAGWNIAVILAAISLTCVSVGSIVTWYIDRFGGGGYAIIACFWVLVLLMLIAYYMVCTVSPGRPKDIFGIIDTENDVPMRINGNDIKMCHKCKSYKPDRCHHCSDCEQCTLKMDHHCPWVNNCVGFRNYKFFYLFLFYSASSCIYSIGLLAYYISQDTDYGPWHYVYMGTIGIVGIFSLGAVGLLFYHTMLLSGNQTTIEQLKNTDPDTYNLGWAGNVKQTLGHLPLVWCVPCVWGVEEGFDGIQWDEPSKRPPGQINLPTPTSTVNGHSDYQLNDYNMRGSLVEGPMSNPPQQPMSNISNQPASQPQSPPHAHAPQYQNGQSPISILPFPEGGGGDRWPPPHHRTVATAAQSAATHTHSG